jgi:PAS domain S-box-containing protein
MTISVLYVDDETGLGEITRLFLERTGDFCVDTAGSATEALEKMQGTAYDGIVSDYQMPAMDGIAFLKEVRSRYGDLPFILFTGKGREDVVIDAIDNGVDFYLQKGGDPESQFAELAHKIKKTVERRRALENLRKSEEKYRELVENANNIILKFDKSGNITFFNEFAQHFFGYSPEEIIGKSVMGTIVPVTESGSERDLSRMITDIISHPENHTHNENENIKKSGERVWIQWWNKPLFDETGDFAGLLCIGTDITEQKRVEGKLQRFREVIDNARDIILFIRKSDGRIVDFNRIALETYGYTREELPGLTIFEIRRNDSRTVIEEQIARASNGGILFEALHEKKDGTSFPVEVSSFTMTLGEEPVLISFVRDISRRRKVEEALKESELRYRFILQNTNDAILVHEVTRERPGRFIDVNDQACRMLDYTREEMLKMSLNDIDVPEQREQVPAIQQAIFSTGKAVFETDHFTKDRRRIPVEVSARLLELNGRPLVLSVVRDITERRKAEDAIQLANRKLNLLSTITRHDVLNQITALEGYLELSADNSRDPAKLADFIGREKKIAETLKRQILFTKDYEGLGANSPQWQDLHECFSGAARSFFLREITVTVRLEGIGIFADPLHEKVCYNLIDNSLRYGGDGMTRISITAERSGPGLRIMYEDNGVGIAPEDKAHLFERGFGKNTGLGLFLTREILAITGITIEETGSPGEGARFVIQVPDGMYRMSSGPGNTPG